MVLVDHLAINSVETIGQSMVPFSRPIHACL